MRHLSYGGVIDTLTGEARKCEIMRPVWMEEHFLQMACCYRSLAAVFTRHMIKSNNGDFVYYNEIG